MEILWFLLPLIAIQMLAVMSPGPDFAIVTRNSLLYSRRLALYTAVGITFGIAVHVAYSLLGISYIIAQSIVLFSIVKYLGAAYLIYIGVKSLLSKKQNNEGPTESEPDSAKTLYASLAAKEITPIKAWQNGFLTNVLNPKATLFIFTMFTQFISPDTTFVMKLLVGAMIILTTIFWFTLVALFFSAGPVQKRFQGIAHILDRIFGAIIVALGIKVALSSQK